MAYILYYSLYCAQCQKLLQKISKSPQKDKIHFICIDNRKVNPTTGNLVVTLENGQNIIIPPNINRVPALIILTQNNRVLFGCDEISHHFQPSPESVHLSATVFSKNVEPAPFTLNSAVGCGSSGFGVTSDQYSFYSMTPDEISTKGKGGLRQMHNYVSVDSNFHINTPKDDYIPDKISENGTEEKLKQYESARNVDVNLSGLVI